MEKKLEFCFKQRRDIVIAINGAGEVTADVFHFYSKIKNVSNWTKFQPIRGEYLITRVIARLFCSLLTMSHYRILV